MSLPKKNSPCNPEFMEKVIESRQQAKVCNMAYHLDFTDKALDDIDFHRKPGTKPILKKLQILLEELAEHLLEGTGI